MTFIRQRNKSDCGIACLAMLCDVTYEEAERVISKGKVAGTTTKQLRTGAIKLGVMTESTPLHRLKVLRGDNWMKDWKDVPDNSLVKVPYHKEGWHWVVWNKGKIYDPARGVFSPKRYDKFPNAYMKFIKVEDMT